MMEPIRTAALPHVQHPQDTAQGGDRVLSEQIKTAAIDQIADWMSDNEAKKGTDEYRVMIARAKMINDGEDQVSGPAAALVATANGILKNWGAQVAGGLGAGAALLSDYDNAEPSEVYSQTRDQAQDYMARAEAEHPNITQGFEMGGDMSTSFMPAGRVATGMGAVGRTLQAAGTGFVGGAAWGAGEGGDTETMLGNAWDQGTQGALFAGVGSGVGAGLGRGSRRTLSGEPAKHPNAARIKKLAQKEYDRGASEGIRLRPEAFSEIVRKMHMEASEEGAHRLLTPDIQTVLKELGDQARGGVMPSFKDLNRWRQFLSTPAGNFNNPNQQRIAIHLRGIFDNAVENLSSGQLVAGRGVQAKAALAHLRKARKLWRAGSKLETLGNLVERATQNAQINQSAMGLDRNMQQAFKALRWTGYKPSAAWKQFTKTEQRMISDIIDGNPTDAGLRWLSQFAPKGIMRTFLTGEIGNTVGGMVGDVVGSPEVGKQVGHAAGITLGAGGAIARGAQNSRTSARISNLEKYVAGGGGREAARGERANQMFQSLTPRAALGISNQNPDDDNRMEIDIQLGLDKEE